MQNWQTEDLKSSGLETGLAAPLLESLMLNAFDSITLTSARPDTPSGDWPITYVNPAFELMTGYGREEAIGNTPKMLQGPKTDPEVIDVWCATCPRGGSSKARRSTTARMALSSS